MPTELTRIIELFQLPFMQRALLGGILTGLMGGMLGSFTILRQLSFFSDALGHLSAGKTTLLTRILTYEHGKKVAVIVNEFGEVGIDNQLVINADEEIFEMNNGCICCTVRGDLIRIIANLMKRRDKFDHLVIETTGLADPAPVIQTFFMDEDVQAQTNLDAVVTVVDAKHIWQHWEAEEAQEQSAFADVVLLNKTDLAQSLLLASASADGWICLWQKAKRQRQTLNGAPGGFSCLSWQPKGQQLAAGGQNGELLIWAKIRRGQGFG